MAYKALANNEEGYPLIYVGQDGNVMCADCATEALNEGWEDPDAIQGTVYWEGPMLSCDDCRKELHSAYGDPNEEHTIHDS